MSEKDLANRLAQIQNRDKNSPAAPVEGDHASLLETIVQSAREENELCPEPPPNMNARIMEEINRRPASFWAKLLHPGPLFIPGIATTCLIAVAIYMLRDPDIARLLSPPTISDSSGPAGHIHYNDQRITAATNGMLLYLEGSVSAIALIVCSLGVVLSALWRRYRLSAVLLIISALIFSVIALLASMASLVND